MEAAAGVRLNEPSIQSSGAIIIVKSYHVPLRLSYVGMRRHSDRQTTIRKSQEMSVIAVSCTVGLQVCVQFQLHLAEFLGEQESNLHHQRSREHC